MCESSNPHFCLIILQQSDKARKKVEDKLRSLGGGPDSAHPAAVHGRAVLELYGELKGAVQRFEEGDEAVVRCCVVWGGRRHRPPLPPFTTHRTHLVSSLG